jgi:hypothetical protein
VPVREWRQVQEVLSLQRSLTSRERCVGEQVANALLTIVDVV